MKLSLYRRYSLWEMRGGAVRFLYFVASLAVGVAAVVVVGGLARGFESGVRGEARQLLAADLVVRSSRPLDDDVIAAVESIPSSRQTQVRELVTIVATEPSGSDPGRTRLVELKVVDGVYPFYGELELEPRASLADLLDERSAVVAPELLAQLALEPGDTLRIGGEPFGVVATILSEPDRIVGAMNLGPRVFINAAGLDRARLLSLGSRVRYRLLTAVPAETSLEKLRTIAEELREKVSFSSGARVETYDEAQPSVQRGLRRVERYIGLVALLSLLIGGIGVGQAIRTWIAGRTDAIAILKCLGARPREVLLLFLGQALFMGLVGSLVGCLVGVGIQAAILRFAGGWLPTHLIDPWQTEPLVRGLVLGLGVTFVFGLSPLTQVLRVPPARVLRSNAEPLPGARWIAPASTAVVVLAIGGMAMLQSSSALLGLQFTGGVLATAIALTWIAWALTRSLRRVPRELGQVWLRHGLASIARPGAARLSSIVALGLGVLVVFATVQVQTNLNEQLENDLPDEAPSAFMIDVQPDQWSPLRELLEGRGASRVTSVPVIMARIRSIDGRTTDDIAEEGARGGSRWAMRREQRLTYLDELADGNDIVAGSLWSDPDVWELSVEEEFASDLGLDLGSVVRFDIQGVSRELVVTSLRAVDWESFGINFFFVAEPGALDEAPQFRLATAQLPEGEEQDIQDELIAAFPNVTIVLVREVLDRILDLLDKLGWGVRFLGGFTAAAGLAILAGSIGVESQRRGREVALLKTLGMKRRGVVLVFATEYALIGLVAGIVGAVGGGLVSYLVLTHGMELPWSFFARDYLGAALLSAVVAAVAGVGASQTALRRRPAEVLRTD